MIGYIIKTAGRDVWDDAFNLVIYNLLWVGATAPSILFANAGFKMRLVVFLILAGLVFWLSALATFGLFFSVKDISDGKVVRPNTFFAYIRQTWRIATIWGVINLIAIVLFVWNFQFYATLPVAWGQYAQILFSSLMFFWVALQLVMLPMYPRLYEPSFKLALRNATGIMGQHIGPILVMVIIITVIVVASSRVPMIPLLLGVSFIAVLSNRTVDAIVKDELGKEELEEEKKKKRE